MTNWGDAMGKVKKVAQIAGKAVSKTTDVVASPASENNLLLLILILIIWLILFAILLASVEVQVKTRSSKKVETLTPLNK